jgi:hypothetical protein
MSCDLKYENGDTLYFKTHSIIHMPHAHIGVGFTSPNKLVKNDHVLEFNIEVPHEDFTRALEYMLCNSSFAPVDDRRDYFTRVDELRKNVLDDVRMLRLDKFFFSTESQYNHLSTVFGGEESSILKFTLEVRFQEAFNQEYLKSSQVWDHCKESDYKHMVYFTYEELIDFMRVYFCHLHLNYKEDLKRLLNGFELYVPPTKENKKFWQDLF